MKAKIKNAAKEIFDKFQVIALINIIYSFFNRHTNIAKSLRLDAVSQHLTLATGGTAMLFKRYPEFETNNQEMPGEEVKL